MKKYLTPFLLFVILTSNAMAQQTASLPDSGKNVRIFKGTKIIDAQTTETLKKRTLDFRVTHLFGNMGAESGGGFHDFYGIDQSKDIRIALDYGICDRWTIGVSRCKRNENIEGSTKFKIIEQGTGQAPFAVALFANMTYSNVDKSLFVVYDPLFRFTYVTQLIIASKFSKAFSFEIVPSYVHLNLVPDSVDKNDLLSLGAGFRWKFTHHIALIADYFYTPPSGDTRYDPIAAGIEIETGGHLFSIMFSNASGILENDFIPNTTDSWSRGGYKLSFIISRLFKL